MTVHYPEIVSNDVDTLTAIYQRMHAWSLVWRRGLVPSKIRHDTRYLDVGFLERRQPIVEVHAATRDLALAAHHGPPEALLGVGYKKLRVSSCATKRFTRRSASGKSRRIGSRPALRSPVPLQRLPRRSPILRSRFHHHLVDLALDEPLSKRAG
jgi:hypothetical protein